MRWIARRRRARRVESTCTCLRDGRGRMDGWIDGGDRDGRSRRGAMSRCAVCLETCAGKCVVRARATNRTTRRDATNDADDEQTKARFETNVLRMRRERTTDDERRGRRASRDRRCEDADTCITCDASRSGTTWRRGDGRGRKGEDEDDATIAARRRVRRVNANSRTTIA